MKEYDEFEAELIEAGWSLDEIEEAWQKHIRLDEYPIKAPIVPVIKNSGTIIEIDLPDCWGNDGDNSPLVKCIIKTEELGFHLEFPQKDKSPLILVEQTDGFPRLLIWRDSNDMEEYKEIQI